ncbi:hypothetical protein Tco_0750248 [Tanacetum coccineum]|uniref:Uncharacterized protein n=1 Tax=Tanacetum coccineum TaxID=301880 RepID=A0ABQ4Z3H8_9ASTR
MQGASESFEDFTGRPPKMWKECLELAREFIKGKMLNAKWRSGDEAPKGNHNENDKQHQDNRSRPKFGQSPARFQVATKKMKDGFVGSTTTMGMTQTLAESWKIAINQALLLFTCSSLLLFTSSSPISNYEEDIGLSEDDGVNEELGIDVDDDEDDEDDY